MSPFLKIDLSGHFADDLARLFINAVINEKPGDAKKYLAKNLRYFSTVDFDRLADELSMKNLKYSACARFEHIPNGVTARSVIVGSGNHVLNLYMLKEPDAHGNWKICGIVRD